MGCKDWGFPKFESGNLYPDFQSCVAYFSKNNCHVFSFEKVGLTKSLTGVIDLLSSVTFPAMLSLKSDDSPDNHMVCVWQNHIIDYESQFTYELSIQGLCHACGPSTVIVQILDVFFFEMTKKMKKGTETSYEKNSSGKHNSPKKYYI